MKTAEQYLKSLKEEVKVIVEDLDYTWYIILDAENPQVKVGDIVWNSDVECNMALQDWLKDTPNLKMYKASITQNEIDLLDGEEEDLILQDPPNAEDLERVKQAGYSFVYDIGKTDRAIHWVADPSAVTILDDPASPAITIE